MSSPDVKVYTAAGNYEASCKHWETAAVLVAFLGDGSTIRWGHLRTLYTEGKDGKAYESYDEVAAKCQARLAEKQQRAYDRSRKATTPKPRHSDGVKHPERCTCCDRELDPAKTVWLELNSWNSRYSDPKVTKVPDEQSQGMFAFGATCARKVLKNGGDIPA